jgi:hypothetical protein
VQKTDTVDRQNTTGEGITKKNPELEYRTEKIKSLVYVV